MMNLDINNSQESSYAEIQISRRIPVQGTCRGFLQQILIGRHPLHVAYRQAIEFTWTLHSLPPYYLLLVLEQQMTIVCPKSAVQVQWCELKTETLDCVKAGHKQRPKPGQVPAVDTARITVARMAESTCQSPIKVVLLYHHKNTSHRQGLRNPLVLVKMILSVGTRQCILAVFLNVIVPVFFFDRTPELAFIKNL